ncbi:MAG: hypothetical protein CVU05_01745 [Bacteroidetes bacterium HGW-Bacteroidetes-21]|jgi:pimeloyl-ACP methyl ester carboxylesterase|nr:MAG: hypothetical protein CVU05_01745 [Bacteroidetes bacterium HGW-Bacteroidetes-21]
MKKSITYSLSVVLILLTTLANTTFCQPYPIGSRQITFNDPARSRNIAARVYYPATVAGTDVNFANGSFPLLIFGHGFSMSYDAYLNFRDTLVPMGYILVLPTTEVGPIPFPNHEDFAADLKFLNQFIKSQNTVSTSVFYGRVSGKSAIMGHSMGGGASILASAGNQDITTMIVFAPAETNTSAIDAATGVEVPALVFSGELDGVTLPNETHIPMYDNLGSSCKTFVNILGGGHCLYALSNWACDFGESSSSPQPTITREEQQITVFSLLKPYLQYNLYDDASMGLDFINKLNSSTQITFNRDCSTVNIQDHIYDLSVNINPNPANNSVEINLSNFSNQNNKIEVVNIYGTILKTLYSSEKNTLLDLSDLPEGLFNIRISNENSKISKKLLIIR